MAGPASRAEAGVAPAPIVASAGVVGVALGSITVAAVSYADGHGGDERSHGSRGVCRVGGAGDGHARPCNRGIGGTNLDEQRQLGLKRQRRPEKGYDGEEHPSKYFTM